MNDEIRTIEPDWKAVRIDATQYWDEAFLSDNRIAQIYDVYIYDANEQTYCCEMTPSFALHQVDMFPIFKDDDPSEEDREFVLDALEEALAQSELVSYFHCRTIEALAAADVISQKIEMTKDEWETDEAYSYLCEEVCGEYRSNPDW
jgi:hypothetical protein